MRPMSPSDIATLSSASLGRVIQPKHIGIHVNKSLRPVPPVKYGIIRSHSTSQAGQILNWRDTETSKGVFNWSVWDAWIAAHLADGKEMIVDLSSGADWTVAASAVGGSAWGGKSNMAPDNDADWVDWITAFATRYAGNGIIYGGAVNEPNLTKYWAGAGATNARLVTLQRLLYQTVKSIEPDAIVLSPEFTSVFTGVSGLTAYLATADGLGGTGADWFDVCAYHFYSNDTALRPTGLERMYRGVKAALTAAGKGSVEIWATETGVINPGFLTLSQPMRTALVQTFVLTLFALGVRRVLWFSVDENNIGFAAETTGDWNDIYDNLVGNTLISGEVTVFDQIAMQAKLVASAGTLVANVTGMPITNP